MIVGPHDTAKGVLIIAEIGNNHEGCIDVAEQLIHEAAACGADAVKVQTFRTDYYVSRTDPARYQRLKRFELRPAQFEMLSNTARNLGLAFIATPFDLESAAMLEPLVDGYKIASGDNSFYPLIDRVAAVGKPLLISCGLSDLAQIDRTTERVNAVWRKAAKAPGLGLLHCVSAYPAPLEQANLLVIDVLAERYGCAVGYSDHTLGIEAAVIAVARGARIVEKHFTLDKNYSDFRDHQLSADPPDFRALVGRIRATTMALGVAQKRVQPCEEAAVSLLRRSIVAAADLQTGHVIAWTDLTWIRPAGGLPPGDEHQLVGRPLRRDVTFGEPLLPADVGEPGH